jgi:hypothetical protein
MGKSDSVQPGQEAAKLMVATDLSAHKVIFALGYSVL